MATHPASRTSSSSLSFSAKLCVLHANSDPTPVIKHTRNTSMDLVQGSPLVDGYAPFCKHVFVPNFVGASVGALPITPDNSYLLRSGYSRRRPDELAVLTRWA